MSSDSDYEFDDDDEFIALTLKPPKQRSVSLIPSQVHQERVQNSSQNDQLLLAKGEIAVLRAKLLDLERAKLKEREDFQNANQQDKLEKESKIKALENSVQRLEDERKFLSVEVRNLNSRKKRKHLSEDPPNLQDNHEPDSSLKNSKSSIKVKSQLVESPIDIQQEQPKKSDVPEPSVKQPIAEILKLQTHISKNDNILLIDNILNQTIIGLSKPSIKYLEKITLFTDYNTTHLKISKNDPIANPIMRFLFNEKHISRLDHYVTLIINELIQLIFTIMKTNDKFQILPIPFLLSLIHAALIFRPSAISNELKEHLVSKCFKIIFQYDEDLRPDDINFSEYSERHKKVAINVIQFKLIYEMSLQFSFEIIEIIVINLDYSEDLQLFEKFVKAPFLEFTKSILIKDPCINLVASYIEIVNCSIGFYEDQDEFPLIDEDIINILLLYIDEGFQWKQDWLFSGLNRIIGNNLDAVSIEHLINEGVSKYSNVVHPIQFTSSEDKFKVQNQHDYHLINLQLDILILFEKIILSFSNGVEFFNNGSNYLKILILSIAKQQEQILKIPRDNLTYLRSNLISSMIRVLHLIWELTISGTNETSPLLPKDLTHILMVVLSRIAFSNNETGEEAAKFLYALREKGFQGPVFNKWAESRAREIGHINTTNISSIYQDNSAIGGLNITKNSDFILRSIVHAEVSFSNGLEFAYDDDVIELARDILEKCTTMDEADSLYASMNAA